MLTFRGLNFEFDIFDEDCALAYEDAMAVMQEANEHKVAGESLAENIRRQCHAIFSFFDTLFGEDTHKDIFGQRVNLNDCLDAYKEFFDRIAEQRVAMDTRIADLHGTPPTPNRATRRSIQS